MCSLAYWLTAKHDSLTSGIKQAEEKLDGMAAGLRWMELMHLGAIESSVCWCEGSSLVEGLHCSPKTRANKADVWAHKILDETPKAYWPLERLTWNFNGECEMVADLVDVKRPRVCHSLLVFCSRLRPLSARRYRVEKRLSGRVRLSRAPIPCIEAQQVVLEFYILPITIGEPTFSNNLCDILVVYSLIAWELLTWVISILFSVHMLCNEL